MFPKSVSRGEDYVDMVERVLDKGIVIHCDIVVNVSGITVLGMEAHVVIASLETYLRYASEEQPYGARVSAGPDLEWLEGGGSGTAGAEPRTPRFPTE